MRPICFTGGCPPVLSTPTITLAGVQVCLRQIYVIRRNPQLEQDVQDVFITRLEHRPDRNVLEITNEAGGRCELDLETLVVKTVAGKALLGI